MKYLPEWSPFIKFKQQAAKWKQIDQAHRDRPFTYVEKQMVGGLLCWIAGTEVNDLFISQAEGVAEECFTSKLLENEDGSPVDAETRHHIKVVPSVTTNLQNFC